MKLYFVFFFLIMFNCFGQEASEIDKVLGIADSIEHQKEIRIYKNYFIADKVDVFRMYNEGEDNWIVDIISYSKTNKTVTKINQIQFPKKNIGKLKSKDANLIWLNLLLTNVEFLPNMKSIQYKLSTPVIDLEKGEQVITKKKVTITDGVGYKVCIKNGKINNKFSFNNPEGYLKQYPNVDELIAYNELLSVIKKEFNLWNN